MEKLVEHVLAGGVHGLFILGTTGEGPSQGYRLREELIQRVCRQVTDRVPVMGGITDTAFVESVNMSKTAAEAGAAGVVLSTPYYFPAGQTELEEYVRKLVPELALPVMLYNMPTLTKVWFEIETLHRLSDLNGIVGVKDSTCLHRVEAVRGRKEPFEQYVCLSMKFLSAHLFLSGSASLCIVLP